MTVPREYVYRALGIVIAMITIFLLVRLAQRLARRYVSEPARLYNVNRNIRRVGGTVAAVMLLILLSPDVRGLLAVLTVIGAGLAIALREALLSVAGWIRLALIAPYRIGDRIEMNDVRGDVIDIRMLRTTLMEIGGWVDGDQSTGRIVHIPNSWLFEYALFNYTRGFRFIWNELPFSVTYRSDWRAARDIMQNFAEESAEIVTQQASEELRKISSEFLIHYSILTPFVYVSTDEKGVKLTLRYLCEARKRRGTEHAFTINILDAFREHPNIEIAYPITSIALPDTPQFGELPPAAG
ncbi:MAG: mechanosensitive ion channel family protein [Bacteroidetes bacterium]|nr:mechanosensitive ion channel family protein [Bacteroidota bacterium]